MNTVTHNLIGEDTRATLVGDPGVPGWSDAIVVQGSKRTMLFGLQTIPGSNGAPGKKLFAGHFFLADTRDEAPSDVAKTIATAIDQAGWQDDFLRRPIQAFGVEARMSREGWIARESDAIPIQSQEGEVLSAEVWDTLLAEDVISSDSWLRQPDLLATGARMENETLTFDPARAELMAPLVENHPILKYRHFPKIEALASDIERGNDQDSVIARHFDCTRKCAKAMRAGSLTKLGVDLADARSVGQIAGHLRLVPDKNLPKTAEDMKTLLAVIDFANEAQGRGLRKDAPEAFIKEASADWVRAATALRTAGAFTAADPIWEAAEDIGTGAPTADNKRNMSLVPGITFKEVTHLSRAFNEKTFAARYSIKGLPEVFPPQMAIEGGQVSEIMHGNALATLGLEQGTSKTRDLWRKVAPEIESGKYFAFAVHDDQGAPIGAIFTDAERKKVVALPAAGARTEADKVLLSRGQEFVETTIFDSEAGKIAERQSLCDGKEIKVRFGQLQHRVDARKKSRTENLPMNWALAEADLPPALRKLGPDGFAAHYTAIKAELGLAQIDEPAPAKQKTKETAR